VYDADDGGILCAPLLAVERGTDLSFSSWSPAVFERQTVPVSGANDSGKSVLLEAFSILLLEEAHVARERALLFTSSYEDMVRQAARFTVTMKYEVQWMQTRAVSDTLRSAPTVVRRAVKGFDASLDALFSRLPPITELVQRVGRCNRSAGRDDLRVAMHDAFDNGTVQVDEAKGSGLAQLVRKVELRRLARLERQLLLALRRLIEGSRLEATVQYFAPSRGEISFRVPMNGGHTLTAPPAAA
jgi:energy-coupling factor transporter ATP-binding protein EcfA2